MPTDNIYSFNSFKETIRIKRINEILETVELAQEYPPELTYDENGDLVASKEAWEYFERIHKAFFRELPQTVNAQAVLNSVAYLGGSLGVKVLTRLQNEPVYEMVKKTLTQLERDFIDALFSDDLHKPVELAQQLPVFEPDA